MTSEVHLNPSTNEPTVKCPQCGSEIKLTESLAAPLLEATRREYERALAQKDREVAQRERARTSASRTPRTGCRW